MTRIAPILLLAVILVTGVAMTEVMGEKEPNPIKIFKSNGCDECHSIVALDIEVDEVKAEKEKEEAKPAGGNGEKPDPPDLSGIGLERDAKWISNYLRKKEEIDGRKHEKLFKGSTEERRVIALWLADLKHEKEDPEKKTSGDKKDKS